MGECFSCGKDRELRGGCCFDCASAGERRAAIRSARQHVAVGLRNLWRRNGNHRFDFQWAWERATRTGDYAPNGYFEKFGIPTGKGTSHD